MKKIFLALAILAIGFNMLSCKKDKDNPTLTIMEPEDHATFTWGSELHIEAMFEDDRELKSYHIYLGDAAGTKATDFDLMFMADINGKSFSFHEHVVVPDSIGAVYYLYFEVTDAEGKTASDKRMLHFTN